MGGEKGNAPCGASGRRCYLQRGRETYLPYPSDHCQWKMPAWQGKRIWLLSGDALAPGRHLPWERGLLARPGVTPRARCPRSQEKARVRAYALTLASLATLNRYPEKRVIVAFPPARHSSQLEHAATAAFTIGRKKLKDSQLPEEVVKPDGFVLRRPTQWN